MQRLCAFLVLSFLVLPLSALAANDAVDRAVKSLGGAEALGRIQTLSVQGSVKHWEPGQSEVPGGEKRFAGDSTFTLTRDLAARSARTEWVRKLAYPRPREYTFTEIVVNGSGYVQGIDTTARTKQSQESNPPAHSMSNLRAAAAARELARSSPLLVLEMQRDAAAVSAAADVKVGERTLPALRYRAGGYDFIVVFDRTSGLPERVRTLDYDSLQGDVNYDLVLSDWKDVGGVKIAHRQVYELEGTVVADAQYQSVQPNPSVAAAQFQIPQAYRRDALKAGAAIPYQWAIRRQFAGTYLDSDNPSYDTGASAGLKLAELAPGIQLVQGGTHNSLIVEMKDHLIVFDAPVSDAQSQWTLQAAKQKFPGKPVKFLVLTHHHVDHVYGARSFLAEGATLVVGAGDADYFRKAFAAPHTRNPLVSQPLAKVEIREVADQLVLGDGARNVGVYLTENPHAKGMLIGYVEDAKLGFVADIWSPGRDPLPAQADPGLASIVAVVKKHGLTPERFAGGHGNTAPYAPLAQLVGSGS
jgi:glyoxylase-like metal-dependent hydrolase (beta-lactamase superfamily II)